MRPRSQGGDTVRGEEGRVGPSGRRYDMGEHRMHQGHAHSHAAGCGHMAIQHGDHTDYVHEGHLHHPHGDHVDECAIDAAGTNPSACTPSHACSDHEAGHRHGAGCGHETLPHGGHTDYVVGNHLHHAHESHCDDH